ncbi:MAG: recombinase family protein [Lachnospiraceae bacterium]|nr:recombinase family protein [Lachnospiraceae bacterium]
MKRKIVIAIYMRLSQDDGDSDAESNSIVNQRHLLHSYVEKHFENYDLLEFQDDGYTGTNFLRPGVSELLEKVRNGQVDCIIVKDLSRFSRDYIEIGAYLEQIFPFAGVRFLAVNDGYDSERFKGNVAGMDTSFKNLMNDLYCKDISVKVKSALKMKKENGIYANGSCTFGYRKDPKDRHKLLIDDEEAEIVRRIFQMALDGLSSHKIAQIFHAEGVKTPIEYKIERGIATMAPKAKHFEWNASTICQMLRNATYVGDLVYDKYETPEVSGKSRLKPRSEWKVFRNHHEAIIDRDTFEYIQKSRGVKKAAKHKRHPLIGKMECGNCHKSLKIGHTKNPYVFCGNKYVAQYAGCVDRVNVQFLEQYVLFRLQEEADQQAVLYPVYEETKNKAKQELELLYEKRNRTNEKWKDLQKAQTQIYEEYAFQKRSRADYITEKRKLEKQEARCMDVLDGLEKRIGTLRERLSESGAGGYEYLQDHSFTELTQEVVDRFVKKIVVYDEQNIEVTWNVSKKAAGGSSRVSACTPVTPDNRKT